MAHYYAVIPSELQHHGILGQKWGVRRFQNKDGTLTNKGKDRYSDKESDNKRGLTDKQKTALKIGVAVAGTALLAYGGYKLKKAYTGEGTRIDPKTGLRLLDKNMTDMEHVNTINPGRIRFFSTKTKNLEIIEGSSYNCMLCTTSYELRKRGFDVRAGKSTTGYTPDELFSKIYQNYNGTVKIPSTNYSTPQSKLDALNSVLQKEGSGSRGNVMVYWGAGGGHSMIWENVNGKIKYMDGQTGVEYTDFASQILKHTSNAANIEILRTDNLVINPSEIKKVINNDTVTKTYLDNSGQIVRKVAGSEQVKTAATIGGTALYIRSVKKLRDRQIAEAYREEHPNTKLTDAEISKMYRKGDISLG